MKVLPIIVAGCAWLALGTSCRHTDGEAPLTVFAAASLRAVADDAAAAWGAAHHREVRVSYGASSTLARQIDAGAGADVMLSANPSWLDWLEERGRLAPGTRRVFAENSLVLVAPAAHPFRWAPGERLATAFEGKIALGDPAHVPVGVYAKQALIRLGAWDVLEGRVVAAANAGAALRFVTDGGAPAGIVYRTDALVAKGAVRVVAALPGDLHEPIRYAGAGTAGGDVGAAESLLDWLAGPEGQAVLARYGFAPPRAGER